MKLNISINLDADAFFSPTDCDLIDRYEVAATLRRLAGRVEQGALDGTVWDINGNDAGDFSVEL